MMAAGKRRSIGWMVVVMLIIVMIGILIARSYYGNVNRSVDPRIVQARELYSGYDTYARTGNYYNIFALLDSIEQIYKSTAHYRESFELGVMDNNRAAALITVALYADSIPISSNPWSEWPGDSIISLAEAYVNQAIAIYNNWNNQYVSKSKQQIQTMIESGFMVGLEKVEPDLRNKYLEARVREIEKAVLENNRRLSVCYTNLGLTSRYQGKYEDAVEHYKRALELWDRNLDAENNLNKLLNRPVRKRNIIQKLFPPKKDPT
jgi:tetratricopeptide (TPR) repeat protein